ncbi:MAG TPA: TIR domain-containing protein [Hyphomonadaceae bacterium]|jgi:hypothetical protein|nr:TIR domain-containing protein [Hyphomonadaceae bacterium]
MTDVYISYAREDRERVRPLVETLQFEGWDVWWDPSEPTIGGSAALDQKLGSAGAILVVWSSYSRGSEYVRSEAATGLYKNKLIQVRIDTATPPRPFDQVEVVDLSHWMGERDDGNWRQCMSAVRLFAGAPQMAQNIPAFAPPKTKKASKPAPKPPKPRPAPPPEMRESEPLLPALSSSHAYSEPAPPPLMSPPRPPRPAQRNSYLERDRWVAPGPVIVIALAVAAGAAFWYFDPMNITGKHPVQQVAEKEAPVEPAAADAAPSSDAVATVFEDTAESDTAWAAVDRKDPQGLRDYIGDHPKSTGAETARSLLRVIDAQAWVEAVTTDNEKAYQSYLAKFPAQGAGAGAMTKAAEERLTSLGVERKQAIEEIQRGLTALQIYSGAIDGKSGASTNKAAASFATSAKKKAPPLATAAPRELRQFADLIQAAAVKAGKPAEVSEPIIAAATTRVPAKSETDAAEAADKQRQAEAAAAAARAAAVSDTLAETELARAAESNAWREAQRLNTAVSYQAYLTSYATGPHVAEARSNITKLNTPAPAPARAVAYSLDTVSADVRRAAEAARAAQGTANTRATTAKGTAEAAASAAGLRSLVAANGDRFETQIANGAPNGLGSRITSGGANNGDKYRGEIRDGKPSGLGIIEYAANSGNRAGMEKYEGEIAADETSGFGVIYWKNGDIFSGVKAAGGAQRGVISYPNGQRYEGEIKNGIREGYGVSWTSDGQVLQAGRWENGQLVQSTVTPAAPTTAPINLAPRNGGGE